MFKNVLSEIEKILLSKKLKNKIAAQKIDTQIVFSDLDANPNDILNLVFNKYQTYYTQQVQLLKELKEKKQKLDKQIKTFEAYVQKQVGLPKEGSVPPVDLEPDKVPIQSNQQEGTVLSLKMKADPIGINENLNTLENTMAPSDLQTEVDSYYKRTQWGKPGVTEKFIIPEIRGFSTQLKDIKQATQTVRLVQTRIENYLKTKELKLHGSIDENRKVFSVLSDPQAGDKIAEIIMKFLAHYKNSEAKVEDLENLLKKFDNPKVLNSTDNTLNWVHFIASLGRKLTKWEVSLYSTLYRVPARPNDL